MTEDSAAREAALRLYERAIATLSEFDRKGAANPYTSRNGHMFSFIGKDGRIAIRMPQDALEAFIKRHRSERPVAYGVVMKDYALVPQSMARNTKKLAGLLLESFEYIGTLKPKPTTKKKKVAKKKVAKKKVAKKKVTKKKVAKKKVTKKKVTKKKVTKKKVTKKKVTKKKVTKKKVTKKKVAKKKPTKEKTAKKKPTKKTARKKTAG